MKRWICALVLLLAIPAWGEKKYKVVRDSPEEVALLEIQGESDATKRLAMLDEFTQKFASSEALPATYPIYLTAYLELGQHDKAVEFGEKAIEAGDEELGPLLNLVRASLGKQDYARVHKWTLGALSLYNKAMANRPPDLDDEEWAEVQEELKGYGPFLEYSLFVAAERDNTPERLKYIEAFAQAFPTSEKAKKVPALYALTYQQVNDIPKMLEYGEKAIEAEPDNETMLLLLAETHTQQQQKIDEARALAQRLLKVMENRPKPEGVADADWEQHVNNYRGAAHSIIGRTLLLQEKTDEALKELATAAQLLQGKVQPLSPVLYFQGFGYAKLARNDEARPPLEQCVQMGGAYAQAARDLLKKLPVSRRRRR